MSDKKVNKQHEDQEDLDLRSQIKSNLMDALIEEDRRNVKSGKYSSGMLRGRQTKAEVDAEMKRVYIRLIIFVVGMLVFYAVTNLFMD